MKELICITCPRGCHLQVDEANDYAVTGNRCPRGAVYGRKECTHPTRVITSTVRIMQGRQGRVSCKTSRDVPKELMFKIMAALDEVEVQAPCHRGDLVLSNVCDSGADIILTKDVTQI